MLHLGILLKEVDSEIRLALQDKIDFRGMLADKISITRLDYFFRVMRSTFARSTVSDPDAYRDKIKQLTRQERMALKRVNSAASGFSMFSKSAKSSHKSSE